MIARCLIHCPNYSDVPCAETSAITTFDRQEHSGRALLKFCRIENKEDPWRKHTREHIPTPLLHLRLYANASSVSRLDRECLISTRERKKKKGGRSRARDMRGKGERVVKYDREAIHRKRRESGKTKIRNKTTTIDYTIWTTAVKFL